jgi:hypothetical protein
MHLHVAMLWLQFWCPKVVGCVLNGTLRVLEDIEGVSRRFRNREAEDQCNDCWDDADTYYESPHAVDRTKAFIVSWRARL